MSTVAAPPRYMPEDLLTMPDGDRFELVDGELVERPMSALSTFVAGDIHTKLYEHCRTTRAGWAFPEGATYRCFPDDPDKVRRADVSFIHKERYSLAEMKKRGHIRIAPDLAVEVVSPNDLVTEIDEKVVEYLSAGVSLIWVVHPTTRTVQIYRADGTVDQIGVHDEIGGETVLPGFRCKVSAFFETLVEISGDSIA